MNTDKNESPFGEVIYTYTRAHAIADGFQIEVTKTAQEAGIRFPVFLTRAVYDAYVTVPQGVDGQDEAGRLWDIIPVLDYAEWTPFLAFHRRQRLSSRRLNSA